MTHYNGIDYARSSSMARSACKASCLHHVHILSYIWENICTCKHDASQTDRAIELDRT